MICQQKIGDTTLRVVDLGDQWCVQSIHQIKGKEVARGKSYCRTRKALIRDFNRHCREAYERTVPSTGNEICLTALNTLPERHSEGAAS